MAPVSAWIQEPPPRDESRWTPNGRGWAAWNGWSPEVAFAELVGALVAIARPRHVVETGVGQGFVTRRILAALPVGSRLTAFEADPTWRVVTAEYLPSLSDVASPTAADMSDADLVVLDSHPPARQAELALWQEVAPTGSMLVVHDVVPGRPGLKGELADLLTPLGGMLLPNPRGGWIGRKP